MKKLILIIFLLFASCTPYSYKDDNKNSIDILANEPLLIPSYENPDKMVNLDTFLTNYKLKYPKIKKDTIGRDSVMEKNLKEIKKQNLRMDALLNKKFKK